MNWLAGAPHDFAVYWLLVARVGGFWSAAPVLGSQIVPTTVKAPAVAVLALAMLPVVGARPGGLAAVAASLPTAIVPYAGMVVRELVLGLALGFLAQVVLVAVQVGGQLIDTQMGFSVVNVIDPTYGQSVPLMGEFLLTAGLVIFLLVGGDHLLITALALSYRAVPLGAPSPLLSVGSQSFAAIGWAFEAALGVAMPILGVGIIVNLGLGLLGRAAPQLNILATGLPAQILFGIATLMVALPGIMAVLAQMAPESYQQMVQLLGR
jgi:flagellar biosynthetic protein FliR